MSYRDDLTIDRRGVYGAYLSRNLNQGPDAAQSMWWARADIYDHRPSWALIE
ncbi:MAG: hypothetical protein ABFS34_05675 [Gemmatimonadota bacterium]